MEPYSLADCKLLAHQMWEGRKLPAADKIRRSIVRACRKWKFGDSFYTLDDHTVAGHLGVPHDIASEIISFNGEASRCQMPGTWRFTCCSGCGIMPCDNLPECWLAGLHSVRPAQTKRVEELRGLPVRETRRGTGGGNDCVLDTVRVGLSAWTSASSSSSPSQDYTSSSSDSCDASTSYDTSSSSCDSGSSGDSSYSCDSGSSSGDS